MKTSITAGLVVLALASAAQAQKVEVRFDPVDGPPCVARSLDRSNAQQAPVQRAIYSSRVTEIKAVIVAGSGRSTDNAVIAHCADHAKKELGPAGSSVNSGLFSELFSGQVRECIMNRDPRMPIYDIHFVRSDRCVSGLPGR